MNIEILKSKIHKAKITQSNLNYIGSIGIDEDLMDAANMIESEKVGIYNITNGERFDTYIIKAERGRTPYHLMSRARATCAYRPSESRATSCSCSCSCFGTIRTF